MSLGFSQTHMKGHWRQLPTLGNILALDALGLPVVKAALELYIIVSLVMMVTLKILVPIAFIATSSLTLGGSNAQHAR